MDPRDWGYNRGVITIFPPPPPFGYVEHGYKRTLLKVECFLLLLLMRRTSCFYLVVRDDEYGQTIGY
jgi:hypothetical protein